MKIIVATGMLLLIVGAAVIVPRLETKVSAINEVTETVVEAPDCLSVVGDEDACNAAQAVIHRKALEAELNTLEANFEATSAQYDADKASYLEQKEKIEKDLGSY